MLAWAHGCRTRMAPALMIVALLGVLSGAFATTYLERTPEQALERADRVFLGTVADVRVEGRQGTPWTLVTFEVEAVLKGSEDDGDGYEAEGSSGAGASDGAQDDPAPLAPDALPGELVLAFLGGAAPGGSVMTVAGMPAFDVGERVLAFSYADAYASPIVGYRQGLWRVTPGAVRNDDGDLLSVDANGSLSAGGDGSSLDDVLAALEARLDGETRGSPGSGEASTAEGADADHDEAAEADAGEEAATGTTDEPSAGAADAADAASPEPTVVSVDSRGGPLTLPEDVEAAAALWSAAAPGVAALDVVSGSSSGVPSGDRVVFADPVLMGPDILSLAIRVQGTPGIEVRLAPQTYRAYPMVLLHEVGVLLGLPEDDAGVMAYAVSGSEAPTEPTTADVEALRELRRFRPEDLSRDGVVDFDDLVAFGEAYGSMGVNLPADLDGDGAVGPSDLERLRGAYTFTPPQAPQAPQARQEGRAPGQADPERAEPTRTGEPSDRTPPPDQDPPSDQGEPSEPPPDGGPSGEEGPP